MKSKDLYQQEKKSHWFIEGQLGGEIMEACVVLRDQKCSQTKKIMLKKKMGHGRT